MATIHLPMSEFSIFVIDRHGLRKILTFLVCGGVLLGHLSAAQAASVSTKLNVSVRVVRGCHINTNPEQLLSLRLARITESGTDRNPHRVNN